MGRWSDERSMEVDHEARRKRVFEMEVMSGEVGCCWALFGTLVGRFWLRMRWSESVMRFSIKVPRWSL